MKLSTRSRYGLRLLVELAKRRGEGPVLLGDIGRNQQISEKYLSKLVMPLKAAGFLRSSRGSGGGFVLAREPESISLLEVVEALEGGLSIIDCTGDPSCCDRSPDCPTREIWAGLEAAMKNYLGKLNLDDIMSDPPSIATAYSI
jgi:Rrf2 family iron-sulfur cluster assembly transcriptional regulator